MIDTVATFNNQYIKQVTEAVNMFLSIDNRSGLKSVKKILIANEFDMDSTQRTEEASEICLTCNNSKFSDQTSCRKMVLPRDPICLALMLSLPWLSMTY